jgi:DcmR-like sensory protein/putative zinc finger protein
MSQKITCLEVATAITAYLEEALASPERDRFEAHCGSCPKCRLLLEQWQAVVGSLARLEDHTKGPSGTEKQQLTALFREHGLHRPGRHSSIPLGLDAELVAPGDHLAYLWESEQEFAASAGFIIAGAVRGETCVLLGHDEANHRLEEAISRAGHDAVALRRQDRLHLISGMKSADALLEEIAEQVKSAVDRGSPRVRILGNLGWGRPDWPADRDLVRLEARVTEAVKRFPVVVMCSYDVRNVTGCNLLLGGLECHPLTYRRNALGTNGLYVPSETFLAALPRTGK